MANFRGFSDSTGNRKKHRKKHTAAPTLHAMNISNRSHRLTGETLVKSAFAALAWTGFSATRALRVKHHQTQELNLCHLDRAVQANRPPTWTTYRQRNYLPHLVDLQPAKELREPHGWAAVHTPHARTGSETVASRETESMRSWC